MIHMHMHNTTKPYLALSLFPVVRSARLDARYSPLIVPHPANLAQVKRLVRPEHVLEAARIVHNVTLGQRPGPLPSFYIRDVPGSNARKLPQKLLKLCTVLAAELSRTRFTVPVGPRFVLDGTEPATTGTVQPATVLADVLVDVFLALAQLPVRPLGGAFRRDQVLVDVRTPRASSVDFVDQFTTGWW